jgi:hypothetical protein
MVCVVINHDIPTASSINRRQIMRGICLFCAYITAIFICSSCKHFAVTKHKCKLCENKLHRKAVKENATSCLINNASAVLEPYNNGERSSFSELFGLSESTRTCIVLVKAKFALNSAFNTQPVGPLSIAIFCRRTRVQCALVKYHFRIYAIQNWSRTLPGAFDSKFSKNLARIWTN